MILYTLDIPLKRNWIRILPFSCWWSLYCWLMDGFTQRERNFPRTALVGGQQLFYLLRRSAIHINLSIRYSRQGLLCCTLPLVPADRLRAPASVSTQKIWVTLNDCSQFHNGIGFWIIKYCDISSGSVIITDNSVENQTDCCQISVKYDNSLEVETLPFRPPRSHTKHCFHVRNSVFQWTYFMLPLLTPFFEFELQNIALWISNVRTEIASK